MSEIADIIWETMSKHIKVILEDVCDTYEKDTKFHIKQFREEGKLKGVCIYHDAGGIRWLDEAHYLGNNTWIALKMWKWMTKNAKILRIKALKVNKKMFDMYIRMGFKIIEEDNQCYLLERGG